MRKKRKRRRRRRTSLKPTDFITYNFENMEIKSLVHLSNTQLSQLHESIENVINSLVDKRSCEIAKQLIVQLKGIISSVQCNFETLYLTVIINEKYLDLLK